MIILGMGSNLGHRLHHLRLSLRALKQVEGLHIKQVSPVYRSEAQLTENAAPEWNQYFLNCVLACETTLSPQDLLATLQTIEQAMGRAREHERWSPRVVDLDILAWDDQLIESPTLTIPHVQCRQRPFVLWPMADVMPLWRDPVTHLTAEQLVEQWGSRFSGEAPFQTVQIAQRIDTPALTGIINVTPDSFSDGGKFSSAELAFQQALLLVQTGAEVLDIGAESTAPHRKELTPTEEWRRLEPVLDIILANTHQFLLPPTLSVDTRHAEVARLALTKKIDWINDVTGFNDPAMRDAVRETSVDCVVMHHITIPPTREATLPRDQDPVDFLYRWSEKQILMLEQEGIARSRLIIDPGFGFGKTPGQTLALLKNIGHFSNLGVRVLVGHSRKSFLSIFTPHAAPDRDIETLAIAQALAQKPFDYLRVHHVDMCARAFRVQAALSA